MGLCSVSQLPLSDQYSSSALLSKLSLNNTTLQILYGHYKSQKAQYLVTIIQQDNLSNNQLVHSCIPSPQQAIQRISTSRKVVQISTPPKGFQYKKIITCLMPNYNNVTFAEYKLRFKQILNQIWKKGKDFMFVFNQTHQFHGLPNQLLLSLLLLELKGKGGKEERDSLGVDDALRNVGRVRLITQDRNICLLFKLEIQKVMGGGEWESQSYKSTNYPRQE